MAQSYGARVVVLAPDPEGVAAESCVSRVSVPASCIKPIAGSWYQKSGAESAAAAATGARYVDSRPFFCTKEMVCPLVIGGMLTRWDIVHLSRQYGERIGPLMTSSLLGRG